MRTIHLFFLMLLAAGAGAQSDTSAFERRWLIRGSDTMPYRLLLPKNYDAGRKYPLVLFLHGSGERGRDNNLQLAHAARFFLADSNRNAIVVFPQCAAGDSWAGMRSEGQGFDRKFTFAKDSEPTTAMRLLLQLVDEVEERYKVDKRRRYVGGLSMGAMGTFDLVRRKPRTFRAAFAICGAGNPETARKLRRPDWWILHGEKDDVVPPQHSRTMAEAIKAAGGSVQLSLYPNANHNSWDETFSEPNLSRWLGLNKPVTRH
ncbi:alpha/beta hydrolase-fold protein [Flaviaesturariibacter amylovorans]|uniref:Dienelactone hydrolase family protein n=1 Tax=Flaviaesturariibacter amylovorans TaxID=1084520 RepID=A0ABP8H099_9BACT